MNDHARVVGGSLPAARRSDRQMQRLTWVAVLSGLVVWGALVVAAGRWTLDMLRQSSAPAPSSLESVAGVVLYREADHRNDVSADAGIQLFDGDELATSFGSTAVIRLFDGTSLELFPEARVRIESARVGRFNPGATVARLALERGAARVTVPDAENQPHTVTVVTPHAPAAFAPGAYTLRVWSNETRISVWEGRSRVVTGGEAIAVDAGQKVVLGKDPPRYRVGEVLEDVVMNGNFAARFEGWEPWEEREQDRPDVPGRIELTSPFDGPARALRVSRESVRDAHNETGLRQQLGRDVNGARAIVLEARVKVDYSSLSGGGYLGSEYPMMIRIRARDRRGSDQIWTQGFYYANPENRPTSRGILVQRGEWTDFRVDLTQVMSQVATIESIEVFGAGHTFDASITGVRLLVD